MTKEKMKEIGKRLERIRIKLGLKQYQLADKTDTPQPVYNRYEKGVHQPTWEFVQVLCKTFDIDSEWLYDGVGEMFKSSSINNSLNDAVKSRDDEIDLLKKQIRELEKDINTANRDLVESLKQLLAIRTGGNSSIVTT